MSFFGDFESMVSQLSDKISGDVKADPSAFYSYEQYLENITASDTDLTPITSGNAGNGQPSGTPPTVRNGNSGDGQPSGTPPTVRDGNSGSGQPSGTPPDRQGKNGGNDLHGGNRPGGDNAVAKDAVSVVSYIEQRLAILKTQLTEAATNT